MVNVLLFIAWTRQNRWQFEYVLNGVSIWNHHGHAAPQRFQDLTLDEMGDHWSYELLRSWTKLSLFQLSPWRYIIFRDLRMDVYLAQQKLNHQHHVTCFLDVWILKKLFRCGSNVGLPSLELHLSRSPQRWFYATAQYWSRFDQWHIATLPDVVTQVSTRVNICLMTTAIQSTLNHSWSILKMINRYHLWWSMY